MSTEPYRPALDDPNAYVLYRYIPSRIPAMIFIVAFGLTTLFHIFQLVKKRTWYFIPLVIGGIFEAIGFVGRFISHDDIWALGPFIMQSLLILVAPALFAASIYIILGRVILLVDGERYSLVRLKWLTKTFVLGDVFSFLLQGSGGGIQAAGSISALHLGEKIIIIGLFVQLLFFGLFIVVAGTFHRRLVADRAVKKQFGNFRSKKSAKHRHLASSSSTAPFSPDVSRINIDDLPWKRHLYNLYITSALIMVRSIFRVIEFIQGNAGYLLSNELYLYIFDAALMLLVMIAFNWVHPSEVTDAHQRRLTNEAATELERTREGYMAPDVERAVPSSGQKTQYAGGWTPSRGSGY